MHETNSPVWLCCTSLPDQPVFNARLASSVLKMRVEGCLPWLLPRFAGFPPPPEGNIWERHIVVAPAATSVAVEFDGLRTGHSQSYRAGEHHEFQRGLDGLVEPLQLAVGLRMVRRAVDVPGLECPDVTLQCSS